MRAKTLAVRSRAARVRVVEPRQFVAGHGAAGIQSGPGRNRLGSRRIVASDHHDPYASRPAFPHRAGNIGPQRIGEADQTEKCEGEPLLCLGKQFCGNHGACDAQHALALPCHLIDSCREPRALRGVEPAKRPDRLGSAFGIGLPVAVATPDIRHGEEFRPQPVLAHQFEPGIDRIGAARRRGHPVGNGPFHWIMRLACAGQQRRFEEGRVVLAAGRPQFGHGHAVVGQCPGLVGAEKRRRPQHFDRGRTAGQHPGPRQAPGAHHHKGRQHQRKFFRQHRHAKSDAAQQRLQPVSAQKAVEQHRKQAGRQSGRREIADESARLLLQVRWLGHDLLQRPANPADLRAWTRRAHDRHAIAAHHERTGEDEGQALAAGAADRLAGRRVRHGLAHRQQFAGQQQFVDQQIVGYGQYAIGRDAVALQQDHGVAANQLAAGNASSRSIADHQGTGAGHVAQSLEHTLAARFLDHGNCDRYDGAGQQHERFGMVAEHKVDSTCAK